MNNDLVVARDKTLLQQLVLVDGQPACGKAVLDPVVTSMERVELLQLSVQFEYLSALKYLGGITGDGVEALLRLQADLVLYDTMMSRNVNFRVSDQSSAFRDPNYWVYLKRLFAKGNKLIPERIKEESKIEKNNIIAFDSGYNRSKTAVIDANITTLISAIILFFLGSGPVKGFSVTLGVGIFTTLFSVYFIARLLTSLYVIKNKNKEGLI